ncbi:transcriptional regulator, LuxR family [Bradyrhizobium oligotrophicum S58]|uniref:Transcriptional regulator, LuxR family n=1 Tax=Bradyrhizobium oligotrophicum S58 TaxID=1245469 RepID=M4ZDV7_9BRAD|nr:LuxR family transcriptional regulator [Bradyrhizobium oligotrophicum]BAM92008.1 transcriptional regulator, LuxR family [Bradyrhizobium oligotrophicum S58]
MFEIPQTYGEAIADVNSIDNLLELLLASTERFGVTGVFIADLPSRMETLEPHIQLRGWNDAWIRYYNERNYVHIDPIAQLLRERATPYVWSEECAVQPLTSKQRKLMDEARDAGLIDGFTVPIHGPQMRTTCVSFATGAKPLQRSDRHNLHFMAVLSHQRVDQIIHAKRPATAKKERAGVLAPRELECLHWAMHGLKSKEIAFEARLSKRTVDQYLRSAMSKLRAGSRTEAVRIAILDGSLKPV